MCFTRHFKKKMVYKMFNIRKIVFILIGIICLSGCTKQGVKKSKNTQALDVTPNQAMDKSNISHTSKRVPTLDDKIKEYMLNMSVEQKIGQLLMPSFRQSQNGEDVDKYIAPMEKAIKEYQVGGVILFKENIKTKEQVKLLINQLQEESSLPLFIAVDEEGGSVSRIASNPEMGFSPAETAFEIGEKGDSQLAYNTGKQLGQMLNELGFNMNFAPVADTWSNPKNTVIGNRSFGKDPELVSTMVVQLMKGLQDSNIISIVKHFPGHGDTIEDTHTERAFVNRSLEELENRELIPFKAAIENKAEGIMVAHVEVPQLDEGIPASLSHIMITDVLKKQMKFQGLVITDALDMDAITRQFGKGEAALQSFLAGADILLMPDIEEARKALIKAYENKIISEERLNESVYKILYLKLKLKGTVNKFK